MTTSRLPPARIQPQWIAQHRQGVLSEHRIPPPPLSEAVFQSLRERDDTATAPPPDLNEAK